MVSVNKIELAFLHTAFHFICSHSKAICILIKWVNNQAFKKMQQKQAKKYIRHLASQGVNKIELNKYSLMQSAFTFFDSCTFIERKKRKKAFACKLIIKVYFAFLFICFQFTCSPLPVLYQYISCTLPVLSFVSI